MTAFFYVYEHWRLDRDECFYVGKGRGDRAYTHKSRNQHWRNIVAKLERTGSSYEVRIVADGLTEREAFDLEVYRIAFWKDRSDLANRTYGGEGCVGMVHSAEIREKIRRNTPVRRGENHPLYGVKRPDVSERNRQTMTGKPAWNKGKPASEEVCARLRTLRVGQPSWNKGKEFSAESRAKMSASAKKRPPISDETRAKLREKALLQWAGDSKHHPRKKGRGALDLHHSSSTAPVEINHTPDHLAREQE